LGKWGVREFLHDLGGFPAPCAFILINRHIDNLLYPFLISSKIRKSACELAYDYKLKCPNVKVFMSREAPPKALNPFYVGI
jgi:hypothetical protein